MIQMTKSVNQNAEIVRYLIKGFILSPVKVPNFHPRPRWEVNLLLLVR